MTRFMSLAFSILILGGCSGQSDDANSDQAESNNSSSSSQANGSERDYTKTGYKCIKEVIPGMSQTVYIGSPDPKMRDVIAVRTESMTALSENTILYYGDGKTGIQYSWVKVRGEVMPGGFTELGEGYSPDVFDEITVPILFGECDSWPVVPSYLMVPPELDFEKGLFDAFGVE